MQRLPHQYIDRRTGRAVTEKLIADSTVNFIYQRVREKAPQAFQALTSARACGLLGWLRYDLALGSRLGGQGLLSALGVRINELLDDPGQLDTPRKVFERRIRYWQCRPMPDDTSAVVSPSDSRVLMGSLAQTSALFIKEKFFSLAELLGGVGSRWWQAFQGGDYAVFRLTPDKYHYNHVPVSGRVVAHFQLDGAFHSCNPGALLCLAAPYSKNRRVVTVIDSDCPRGTGAGLVAMVEVVALMIGEVAQRYSAQAYDDPQDLEPGMWLEKGQPKSLFRPGSSTVILLFEPGRVAFAPDLLANLRAPGVATRFSQGLGHSLVETEVEVRAPIASALPPGRPPDRDLDAEGNQ
ncbi:MAG: phosphatidylserine decarboxylase [Desulfarculus sp.]|nr:phosphatidylserine decarboxylase [Desulfarculus sp.]